MQEKNICHPEHREGSGVSRAASQASGCFVPQHDKFIKGVMLSLSMHRARGSSAMPNGQGHCPQLSDKFRVTPRFKKTFGLSIFLTFGLALGLLTGCSFNPNLQGKGAEYLQGTWLQDSGAVQQKLLTSYRYHIRFDCDSFFIQINNKSRANLSGDTCVKDGQWTEYLRGTYAHKQDTLLLNGQFATPDYQVKTNTACFRSGPYHEYFIVRKTSDTLIELSGTSSVIPLTLHRTKKTVCTQKPL